MSLRRANQELLRVRGYRNRPEPSWSIGAAVGEVRGAVDRACRSVSGAERAWVEVAPAELVGRAAVVSLARGVLTIRVSDASARWELDRWLRAGGEAALGRAAKAGIRRVRFVNG